MNQVLDVDAQARTATVQPGVVQAQLQRAAAPFGLRFGPDPSTHNRCTIGGMIGNNACGSRSLQYGRTSDNVLVLDVLTAAGRQLRLAGPDASHRLARTTAASSPDCAASSPAGWPRSGPSLAASTGRSPGTRSSTSCRNEGSTSAAPWSAARGRSPSSPAPPCGLSASPHTACSPFSATPTWRARPTPRRKSCATTRQHVRAWTHASWTWSGARGAQGPSPPCRAAQAGSSSRSPPSTEAAAVSRARQVVSAAGALAGMVVSDPGHAAALWRIREDGAGLAGRGAKGQPAYPGWEDSAVPPHSLGPYLRDLDALLAEHELTGIPYGHFGDGCLHLRLDFPLQRPDGRAALRSFLFDAARLVTRYGGSLSGEHGDGRTRSELLPVMYSPAGA